MRPAFPARDCIDGPTAHSVDFGDRCMCGTDLQQLPYFKHVVVGKLPIMMGITNRSVLSSFCHHIVHVVLMAPTKEVSRVAARSIVAGVKHLFSFWNRTSRKNECHPMGVRVLPVQLTLSVSCFFADSGLPWPTFIKTTDLNSGPKSLFKWRLFRPFRNRTLSSTLNITFMASHTMILPPYLNGCR